MDGAMLLPEFDHEFAETRRALEAIPEDKFAWKPHEKSFSLHELSAHIAEVPRWLGPTLTMDVMDLESDYERVVPETKEAILAYFDEGLADARKVLADAKGDTMMEMWKLLNGKEVLLEMPKGAVLRSFIFSHNVHHRAQLGVYLRLLGIPVPGHYGPSADEAM